MTTLTIIGRGIWSRRADAVQAEQMEAFVQIIESRGADDRCATCAFRRGTDANGAGFMKLI